MKRARSFLITVIGALFANCMFAQTTTNNLPPSPEYVKGQVLVKLKADAVTETRKHNLSQKAIPPSLETKLKKMGVSALNNLMPLSGTKSDVAPRRAISSGRLVADTNLSTLYLMEFDEKRQNVDNVIETLNRMEEVELAEPNYIVKACATATDNLNDPLLPEQWGINAINLPQLWAMPTMTDQRPVIAILDTGVDITHPDLMDNIWSGKAGDNGNLTEGDDQYVYYQTIFGWDFVKNEPVLYQKTDVSGHGTHCAGIAAASGGNGIGIVGANPDAQIMTVKVLADNGEGSSADILRGIDFAIANGANVLSMSFSGGGGNLVYQALQKAYARGIVPVAAAGNNGKSIYELYGCSFPAAYDVVVGVMSCDASGNRSSFSNYDPDGPFTYTTDEAYNYEVYAPGNAIVSTYPGGGYKTLNGTSMACPFVAGAISRMLQVNGFDYAQSYAFIGDIAMSYGEGSHVFDAVKAASWTAADRKVAIRLVGTRIDDSKLGNNNGQIDAGETFDIYPTVSSLWGHADNIVVHAHLFDIDVDNDKFEILANDIPLGKSIDSRGKMEGTCGIRIRIKEGVRDGFVLPVHFTLSCDNELDEESRQDFVVDYTINNRMEIGGLYTEDLVLSPGVNYVVVKKILLDDGVKITIKPGTTVRFMPQTGIISHFGDHPGDYSFDINGTPEEPIHLISIGEGLDAVHDFNLDIRLQEGESRPVVSNVIFENFYIYQSGFGHEFFDGALLKNCVLDRCLFEFFQYVFYEECQFTNSLFMGYYPDKVTNSSFANNKFVCGERFPSNYWSESWQEGNPIVSCNFVDNLFYSNDRNFWVDLNSVDTYCDRWGIVSAVLVTDTPMSMQWSPNYYGSSSFDLVNSQKVDSNTPEVGRGFGTLDLSNMLTQPSAEAPAVLWKVVVDGYDAQDEFAAMPPLGVGRHKFEVYFSRPVDKNYVPTVSMGMREPFTQTMITEDGSWNEDGTVYTTYLDVTPRNAIVGIHTIRVAGARQDNLFEVPIEATRFRVHVETMGSMSTGLYAEAGIGKVDLNWKTDSEDLNDLMGYNIYRFTLDEGAASDSVMINTSLIEPTATSFTDYDVVPGNTYYYVIKQLTTALEEINVSDAVHATPHGTIKGDSNGSTTVDVADVITDVAYVTFQNPQPFLFDAADVDDNGEIDILDIMTTVNMIVSPSSYNIQSVDKEPAVATIRDGILSISCPVAVGGIQVGFASDAIIEPLDVLKGFEMITTERLFLAYSMSGMSIAAGTHDILSVGDADVSSIVLSDVHGKNIPVTQGEELTGVMSLHIGNADQSVFDLTGRRITGAHLSKGLYIVNNKKIIKR